MSTNLYWNPVLPETGECLTLELKWALRKRYDGIDFVDMTLDCTDISYLKGLKDAGLEGAQKLIDGIETHGEIRVKEA